MSQHVKELNETEPDKQSKPKNVEKVVEAGKKDDKKMTKS